MRPTRVPPSPSEAWPRVLSVLVSLGGRRGVPQACGRAKESRYLCFAGSPRHVPGLGPPCGRGSLLVAVRLARVQSSPFPSPLPGRTRGSRSFRLIPTHLVFPLGRGISGHGARREWAGCAVYFLLGGGGGSLLGPPLCPIIRSAVGARLWSLGMFLSGGCLLGTLVCGRAARFHYPCSVGSLRLGSPWLPSSLSSPLSHFASSPLSITGGGAFLDLLSFVGLVVGAW